MALLTSSLSSGNVMSLFTFNASTLRAYSKILVAMVVLLMVVVVVVIIPQMRITLANTVHTHTYGECST